MTDKTDDPALCPSAYGRSVGIHSRKVSWILDADIRSFFDTVSRPPAHLWCSPWHLMQPLTSADVTVATVSGASNNRFHFTLQYEFDGRRLAPLDCSDGASVALEK